MARHRHRRDAFATDTLAWGLSVLVVLPAFLFGAVLPVPQAIFMGFTALLFLWAAISRSLPSLRLPPVVFVFVAAAIWAAVQGLPLDEKIVLALQGPAADRAAQGFLVAGVASPWWSLSMEPTATWVQAVRALAYAAVFVMAWAVTIKGRGRTILHAIAFLGLAEMCIGIFHAATAPEGLSVIYPGPLSRRHGFHITLLNDNHAAGLFILCASVWLALALEQGGSRARTVFAFGAALMGVSVFATLSRGGAAALTTVAIVGVGAYFIRNRFGRGLFARPVAWLLLIIIVAANAYVWLAFFEDALMKYGHTSLEPSAFIGKVRIWEATLPMITDHPWFGVGAGAFPSVMATYSGISGYSVDRAENAILQAVADYGIPVGLGLVAVLVVLFIRQLARLKEWPAGLCVGGGLVAIALQNLGDFGLEVPGLAVPVVAAMGYLFGHPSGSRDIEAVPIAPRSRRSWFVILAVLLLGACAFGIFALDMGTMSSHLRLGNLVRDLKGGLPVSSETVESVLADEVRLHPLDAHLFSLGAQAAAVQGRHERALVLAEHALVLSPDALTPSRLRVRLLTRMGRTEEAVVGMRRLLHAYPERRKGLFQDLRSLNWPPSIQAQVFEGDPQMLESYLDFLKRRGDLKRLESLLRAVLDQDPDEPMALGRLGWLLLATKEREAASDVAWRLIALHPDRDTGYDLAGRILFGDGLVVEALAMFREAAGRASDPTEAQMWVLACLARLKEWETFDALARKVEPRATSKRALYGRYARILADAEYRRGRVRESLRILERAWNRDPTDADNLVLKARILRAEKREREAMEWYRRALRLKPGNEAIRREMDALDNRGLKREAFMTDFGLD